LLLLAIGGAFAAQARTLTFFFFQDDYVPFGEIVTNGARTYLWNLITLQDLTPNWRVMPGLTYLLNYSLFGMSPLPTRLVMLALHLGVVALLYRAVWRTTASAWAAFAAAMVFGLHPGYAGTLGQLGSATYPWAAFFLAATLNAVIECVRADDARVANTWLGAGLALYILALMSNESMAILFPAYAVAFWLLDSAPEARRRLVRAGLRALPFAALGFLAAASFAACDCTAASDTFGFDNVHRAALIYLGRLLYPIGLEPPTYIDPPHLWAGIALLLGIALMLVRGPAIGRVGAAWMLLAIVPHALIETHTAHRFVYLATPGFALMSAGIVLAAEPVLRRAGPAIALSATAAVFLLVAPWYAWQTHLQNEPYRRSTGDWSLLHDELERVFPEVAPGARVEVVGGPLTHPLDNFFVMPALGFTIWGLDVILQTVAVDDPYAPKIRASDNPYAAEFHGRELTPLHEPDGIP
jgi:hypothetical protein